MRARPNSIAARVFPNLEWEDDPGCLTLYLARGQGFDPTYYSALLKDVERDLAATMDEKRRLRLEREMIRVRQFISDVRPPGLPLAIFSCVPDELFEALRLADDVETGGYFDTRFHLGPLEEQLERHPPGIVVMVEKDHAEIFAVVLEDVESLGEFQGRHISDTKRAGPNSSRRPVRNHERLNIKEAVELLTRAGIGNRGLQALYLAGPVETRSRFKDQLPAPWRARIRGELDLQSRIGPAQLADQIRKLT